MSQKCRLIVCAILAAYIASANAFSTSEFFAVVLDMFNDTRFHDTQMQTAICTTQYNFLKRNNGLDADPPAMYESCPYHLWLDSISEIATANMVTYEFMYYVDRPDVDDSLKSDPKIHFDGEAMLPTANQELILTRQAILRGIQSLTSNENNIDSTRRLLGQAMHTLQDFYSHTNWVELGNNQFNPDIGVVETLAAQINSPLSPSCRECTKSEMPSDLLSQVSSYRNSVYNGLLLGLIDFDYNNIYVCYDNIVTNKLTSGYYGTEAAVLPKPNTGKCSHGGGTDNSVGTPATGGIAKDATTFMFAPHYYLHHPAADMSVNATIFFLEQLRISAANDYAFGVLIGMTKYDPIAFVIDTSPAMANSLPAMRDYCVNMVNALDSGTDSTILIYVTPFGGNYVGNTQRFDNPSAANRYIRSLDINGEGDSGQRTLRALYNTVNIVPPDTVIYVISAPTYYDPTLQSAIAQTALHKKLQINVIMGGIADANVPSYRQHQNRDAGADATDYEPFHAQQAVSNETMYNFQKLAENTGGILVTPNNNQHVKKLANMRRSKNLDTILFRVGVHAPCGEDGEEMTYILPIDNTMSKLEIALGSHHSEAIDNLRVTIIDGTGAEVVFNDDNLLIDNTNFRFFRFDVRNQANTRWQLKVSRMHCRYNGRFVVTVHTESSFKSRIFFYDQEKKAPTFQQPMLNHPYSLFVDCHDCREVTSIVVTECGRGHQDYDHPEVMKAANRNWWSISDVKLPASGLVCIEYSGITGAGSPFRRLHRERIRPTVFDIHARISSRDFPKSAKVIQGKVATLHYRIVNKGRSGDVTIRVQDRLGRCSFEPSERTIDVEHSHVLQGSIQVRCSGVAFDVEKIDMSVTSVHHPHQVSSLDFLLMIAPTDMNDITPPICNVRFSNQTSCPSVSRRRKSCDAYTYKVEIEYGDEESNIAHVRAEQGMWQLPDASTTRPGGRYVGIGEISCCTKDATIHVTNEHGMKATCSVVSTETTGTVGIVNDVDDGAEVRLENDDEPRSAELRSGSTRNGMDTVKLILGCLACFVLVFCN